MLHITDSQIREVLDYRGVTAAIENAFLDMARGQAAIHGRQRTECEGYKLSSMGAIWTARKLAGIKVYPTVNKQFSFAVILFDLERNTPVAVLDGNELTRWRTAAMTALVASRAAPASSRKLVLFGAGVQGRAQAEALCEIFRFDEVCVVDPVADEAWCAELRKKTGAIVSIVAKRDGVREAVQDADIVVTATRSSEPVFKGEWLRSGAFVSAVGTSTPSGRELDDLTMIRAARVIVEWLPQSMAEAGEIVLWQGQRDAEKVVDLPALFGRDRPWRPADDGITVFKSVGVGLSDLAAACLALERISSNLGAPTLERAGS